MDFSECATEPVKWMFFLHCCTAKVMIEMKLALRLGV